jgi:hypothetical protein
MLSPIGIWDANAAMHKPPASGLAPSPTNEAVGAMAGDPNEERRRQIMASLLAGGGGFQSGQPFGPLQGAQLAATLMQAITAGGGAACSAAPAARWAAV